MRNGLLAAAFVVLTLGARTAPAQRTALPDLCAGDTVARTVSTPSPRSYCLRLVPVPDLRQLSGAAELHRAPSPFTVTVTAEGVLVYQPVIALHNLPKPSTLGPYTTYVAWAATTNFVDEVKLGAVREGRTPVGRIAFNQFVVLITAERAADVRKRSGPVVMRALSQSWFIQPHDITRLIIDPTGEERSQPDEMHGMPSMPGMHESGWPMPPMHPAVSYMLPGIAGLVPKGTPWLPGRDIDVATIAPARPRTTITLHDGDSLNLRAEIVTRSIAGRTITMYGFNGQYPGPLIQVDQQSTIVVNFENRIDQPSAVHWHGIRLDNRFDGTPHVTQELVPSGGRFRYVIHFPDAGIYWYHPHNREDIQQNFGLYGNLFVRSGETDFFARVHREEFLILGDLLLGADGPVPFGAEGATHALMGRFGNVFLVNGAPDYRLHVKRGEVVRFYLTNAANTRVFNVRLGGSTLKLVGGDVGRFAREEMVPSVVLAPAERYIVEARFDTAGTVALTNHVQAIDHAGGRFFTEIDTLGLVTVDDAPAVPDLASSFGTLRVNAPVRDEIARTIARGAGLPRRDLLLTVKVGDIPFGLRELLRLDTLYVNPVEWSGTMPMMDWLPTAADVTWTIRDQATGRENMDIDWHFRRGELVHLRLVNDRHSLHPMAHPVHMHGQRFLVLTVNGAPMQNHAWKDTVLVPAGGTVDLLVEMSNPGSWMLHCHIAEHLEAGMHMIFRVE